MSKPKYNKSKYFIAVARRFAGAWFYSETVFDSGNSMKLKNTGYEVAKRERRNWILK